jgi:C_GCAxxG_C_C family probable redox protein
VIAVGGHYVDPLPDVLLRVSCPFGGGIGGCQDELCGVLSGAIVVLGALWGRASRDEPEELVRELACQVQREFVAYAGTSTCRPIRDSLLVEEKRCLPVVLAGTRILVEAIEQGLKREGFAGP